MIGRITNEMASQMTLAGIETALDRLDTTQQELSTGKRINQPSDDPSGTALALKLNTDLANLTNYSNQVTDGTGWSQASSSALSDVTNSVQRIRELTLEAANGTQTTADMQASAQEVNQLIDQVKQDANTPVQRPVRVLRVGHVDRARTSPGSNDSYAGNTGQVTRAIGPNTTLAVNANLAGSARDRADGLGPARRRRQAAELAAQHRRRHAVRQQQPRLSSDLSSLDTNLNSLTGLSANVGAVQDRLQMASSRIQTLQASDTQVLSNTQDADMAADRDQLLDPAGGPDRGPASGRAHRAAVADELPERLE